MDTRTTAARFRTLHQGPEPLLLPNAWDAGSARVIEASGAQAIATTSAGLAWARGYADGYALPVRYLVATVTEIARVIRVPLSVDMEAGDADDLAAIAKNAQALASAGAVGINLEDGASPPEVLCERIAATKRGAARAGVDLFVNARCDVYLRASPARIARWRSPSPAARSTATPAPTGSSSPAWSSPRRSGRSSPACRSR
jgi:2-methylisocitrate lyase-like PEP mutase family enzyme